jgi:hypothetical protein
MKWNSPTFCELCHKKLIGVAEINSMIDQDETVIVTVKESKVIDWVFCKLCQSVVCRESCFDMNTGFCKPCSKDFNSDDFSERNPIRRINENRFTDDVLSSEIVF